jgi:hypothetical protein
MSSVLIAACHVPRLNCTLSPVSATSHQHLIASTTTRWSSADLLEEIYSIYAPLSFVFLFGLGAGRSFSLFALVSPVSTSWSQTQTPQHTFLQSVPCAAHQLQFRLPALSYSCARLILSQPNFFHRLVSPTHLVSPESPSSHALFFAPFFGALLPFFSPRLSFFQYSDYTAH